MQGLSLNVVLGCGHKCISTVDTLYYFSPFSFKQYLRYLPGPQIIFNIIDFMKTSWQSCLSQPSYLCPLKLRKLSPKTVSLSILSYSEDVINDTAYVCCIQTRDNRTNVSLSYYYLSHPSVPGLRKLRSVMYCLYSHITDLNMESHTRSMTETLDIY